MPASPALGRIGGHLLKENLERHGVDLAFRNTPTDDPVMYLRVDTNITKIIASQSLQAGFWYKIRTLDGSDFTLAGAPTNVVGTVFQASGPVPPKSYDLTQVVNGTFDTDISSWVAGGGGTLTWNPLGYLTVDATGGVSQYAQQEIPVTSGGDYRFIATHISGGIDSPTTDFSIQIFDSTFTVNYANITKSDLAALGTPGTITVDFVPTTASVIIRFSAFNCAPTWDNVSLRRITDSNGTAFEIENEADPNPYSTGVSAIGINTDSPAYLFDVNSELKTNIAQATNRLSVDNIILDASGYITTTVGPIDIRPSGVDPIIFMDRLATDGVSFTDNIISNNNTSDPVVFLAHGTGTVELESSTNITGLLSVSGNSIIDGNLTTPGTITVGDSELDVVHINVEFTQDIIPGIDSTYDLGQDARDSSPRRWGEIHTPDLTNINNLVLGAVEYSNQVRIDGSTNSILALQSNDDVEILPDTGINYVESIKIEGNIFTNLIEMPALDATAVSNGIAAAVAGTDPAASGLWNISITTTQITSVGPGSTVEAPRTGPLGDVYNDPGNPGMNANDATRALAVGNHTGGTYNEHLWYNNGIKNYIFNDPAQFAIYGNGADLDATPITLSTTGNGYIKFANDNAFVIPSGTSAERTFTEVGETRWNTETQYLECFDGSVYIIATGPGEVVSADLMTDLAIARSLMLG